MGKDAKQVHEYASVQAGVGDRAICLAYDARTLTTHGLLEKLLALHRPARRKFELTNQDSAGGKNFTVLASS